MKNLAILKILVFLLYALGTPGAFAQTYRVGLAEWLPWATAHVAAEQGYWKAEGLDIEVKQFVTYDSENLPAFEHGKTDFAVLMLGSVVDLIAKTPGKYRIVYAHDWSHGGDLFVLSKQIAELKEVKGKRIGVYTKSAPVTFFIHKVLASAGLSLADVKLVSIPNPENLVEAFRQGKLAAVVHYYPEGAKLVEAGSGTQIATSADFPGVIPEGIAVQGKLLEEHPEILEKFMRGWLKAVHWQSQPENRQAFFALLNRTIFKNAPYAEQDLEAFYGVVKIHSTLADITEQNQTGVRQFVEEMLAFLKTSGEPIRSEKIEDYLDTRLAVEQAQDIFR